MICLWFILIIICIGISNAQQSYDPHDCSSDTSYPGSRYTCNITVQHSCQTFLVYRATPSFQTASSIAKLFNMSSDEVLRFNNFTSAEQILQLHREVLVPINCFCISSFFQANFSYTVPGTTTLTEVACGVYQGLLKSATLAAANPSRELEDDLEVGTHLHVPLRCACPNNLTAGTELKYLVTYPFVEGDGTIALSEKFGISPEDLWAANGLEPRPTVYPNTTVLVPLRNDPVIRFTASDPPPPAPDFLPTVPIARSTKMKNLRGLYIAGSVVGFSLALVALLGCVFYVRVIKKQKIGNNNNNLESPISCSTARSSPRSGQISSTNSCLSPDLLAGIKYSLNNYSSEEMRRATRDFSEDNKISGRFFKGLVDNNVEVMIKQMRFEDTRQVIDMHSKINHINIVNLHGVSYGDSEDSCSYLVFEFPTNGCLRDCLSNRSSSPLPWNRRTQIAFDVATGLHYLHYSTFPTYAHMNVNTRSIFVTTQWRAKLANIGTTPAVGSSKGNDSGESSAGGWVAPEYLVSGSVSEKVDIFAFGLVLVELISAVDDFDGMSLKESIGFLGGEDSEGGCFERLKGPVDPCLKDDYPLAEALCLAVLAKSCVEDDPLRRPSMDDIMKVLTRMVY